MSAAITTHHDCAQAGCREEATHVVIETHPLALLFPSNAGLTCAEHARWFSEVGGAACSLEAFLYAAMSEHDKAAAPASTRDDGDTHEEEDST